MRWRLPSRKRARRKAHIDQVRRARRDLLFAHRRYRQAWDNAYDLIPTIPHTSARKVTEVRAKLVAPAEDHFVECFQRLHVLGYNYCPALKKMKKIDSGHGSGLVEAYEFLRLVHLSRMSVALKHWSERLNERSLIFDKLIKAIYSS